MTLALAKGFYQKSEHLNLHLCFMVYIHLYLRESEMRVIYDEEGLKW